MIAHVALLEGGSLRSSSSPLLMPTHQFETHVLALGRRYNGLNIRVELLAVAALGKNSARLWHVV